MRKIPIDFTQNYEKKEGIIYLDSPSNINWNQSLSLFFHKIFYYIDQTTKDLSNIHLEINDKIV